MSHAVRRLRPSAALTLASGLLLAAAPAASAGPAGSSGGRPAQDGAARQQPPPLRPLARGARGADVRVAQDELRRAGLRVRVDGVFGADTVRAVRQFERAHRLRPDGRLSLADLALLRRLAPPGTAATRVQEPVAATADRAGLAADGTATPPTGAPDAVRAIIAAANAIATKPYRYGGGHSAWDDTGYDCSGSVSYALHGAGLLDTSLTSGELARWGAPGPGQWVTLYANGGHVYLVVAGLRFDTSGRADTGSRWQTTTRPTRGYVVRHPDRL